MEKEKKSYLLPLHWGGSQKRFRFVGDDDDEKFKELCRLLNSVGDNAADSRDFFEKAVIFFAEHGYERMPI
jgi:HJR/Mrr/RecB family endonuclease